MSQLERRARRAGRVVLQVYQKYDQPISDHAVKRGATCRDGCSSCCLLPATASVPEMVPVVEHLVGRTDWDEVKPELERAIRLNLAATDGLNLGDRQARAAFFSKQIACVFLKDGRCSIYDLRPASCRYHYVVSPPENCSPLALDNRTSRLDLRKLEDLVIMAGSSVLGEMTGGTIAAAFAVAANAIGVKLDVDPVAVARGIIVAAHVADTDEHVCKCTPDVDAPGDGKCAECRSREVKQ